MRWWPTTWASAGQPRMTPPAVASCRSFASVAGSSSLDSDLKILSSIKAERNGRSAANRRALNTNAPVVADAGEGEAHAEFDKHRT